MEEVAEAVGENGEKVNSVPNRQAEGCHFLCYRSMLAEANGAPCTDCADVRQEGLIEAMI